VTTDDFPTTRRFARTLAEAFADERSRPTAAVAIEVGPRPMILEPGIHTMRGRVAAPQPSLSNSLLRAAGLVQLRAAA
jgi:hypothetical protein